MQKTRKSGFFQAPWLQERLSPECSAAPSCHAPPFAGPAQALPRPPAHVGPQPCVVVYGVPYLNDPHQGVKVRNDVKGAEHQRVALQEAPRARPQRAAVFRAGWPKPCQSAPAETSCSPSSRCRAGSGLKFRHNVQGDDFPARRFEGPAHRLGAAEKLQESRHF